LLFAQTSEARGGDPGMLFGWPYFFHATKHVRVKLDGSEVHSGMQYSNQNRPRPQLRLTSPPNPSVLSGRRFAACRGLILYYFQAPSAVWPTMVMTMMLIMLMMTMTMTMTIIIIINNKGHLALGGIAATCYLGEGKSFGVGDGTVG